MRRLLFLVALSLPAAAWLFACSDETVPGVDGGADAAASRDATSGADAAGGADASGADAGVDAGEPDAGHHDHDAGLGDAAGDGDAAAADADAGPFDAATPLDVNGCGTGGRAYVDVSGADAGGRVITPWDTTLNSPVCLRIHAGESVTWNPAPTISHPRAASGGTTPSPINGAGTTATLTFPNAGTYGFVCGNHPGQMYGAIHVLP